MTIDVLSIMISATMGRSALGRGLPRAGEDCERGGAADNGANVVARRATTQDAALSSLIRESFAEDPILVARSLDLVEGKVASGRTSLAMSCVPL